MEKEAHINLWYFMSVIVAFMLFQPLLGERAYESVSYSEFQQLLQDGKISEIRITENNLRAKLREARPDGRWEIQTVRVAPDLARDFAQYNVTFFGVVESKLLSNFLSWFIPTLVFLAIWIFFIRRMAEQQGGAGFMSVGKSKAKIYVEKDIKVTFDEVAGVDEAKEELKEIVAFLKNPDDYGRIGARVPKGVLLVGPPGTGKTLLARAVAGEAAVAFFSISGSEFVEMFVGVGAARVRDLFEQARKNAPCIIFIDELDALGRARGAGPLTGGHDEKEQTLNQLLSELDGFNPQQGIVLLAATNRPEILDSALLRAGRFDRQILVDRPDKKGRAAILKVHVRQIKTDNSVDLDEVASLTTGFSGADLANLVNEAAILATRRGGEAVALDDFTAAIERIVAGLEKKNRLLNPYEREIVAYHETGHALVTLALPGTDIIQKVSIIPRGIGALGYNIQRPTEDRYLMTSEELENKMAALLGGRAAEQLVFNTLSTGASNDLDKATDIARSMIMRYGMDETLGLATYADDKSPFLATDTMPQFQSRGYSEKTAREIDEAVRARVGKAFELATAILKENRQLLEETSKKLLRKETLTAGELPVPKWEGQTTGELSKKKEL
jgi:cell division protease FtsH